MARRSDDAEEVAKLARALGLLMRRLRSTAPSESRELSWTQTAVVARLANDGPATTADLARAESMKPQSMGTVVAALEALGFVERTPHPTDGRQVTISLTARGAVMRKTAKDARRTWLAQAVARLDRKDQTTLFAAVEVINQLVEL
jgi:DNA-binding MarR family transcriptional regulator